MYFNTFDFIYIKYYLNVIIVIFFKLLNFDYVSSTKILILNVFDKQTVLLFHGFFLYYSINLITLFFYFFVYFLFYKFINFVLNMLFETKINILIYIFLIFIYMILLLPILGIQDNINIDISGKLEHLL